MDGINMYKQCQCINQYQCINSKPSINIINHHNITINHHNITIWLVYYSFTNTTAISDLICLLERQSGHHRCSMGDLQDPYYGATLITCS